MAFFLDFLECFLFSLSIHFHPFPSTVGLFLSILFMWSPHTFTWGAYYVLVLGQHKFGEYNFVFFFARWMKIS